MRFNKIVFLFLVGASGLFFFQPAEAFAPGLKRQFEKSHRFYQERKYDKAIELAETIINDNPDFYPAYNLIGFCRVEGRREILESIFYFTKSLEINPQQPQIYNFVSVVYNKLGMEERSFEYIKRGLEYNPDSFQLNYSAGLAVLLIEQNPEEALLYFQRAEKSEPDHPGLLYLLGVCRILSRERGMVLESISRLRGLGAWDFAWKLENIIRQIEEGETIDLGRVMEFYGRHASP